MKDYPSWAMLAEDYYAQDFIPFPAIVQPKYNGVRAKWDHKEKLFISRQGKVFPRHIIPHLYTEKLDFDRTVSQDGELYSHGIPFQELCGMLVQHRIIAHPDAWKINFVHYDNISSMPANLRVPSGSFKVIRNKQELEQQLADYIQCGYEGAMIRHLTAPYHVGRTAALLKMKPLQQENVEISEFVEGKGKFKGSLGAFVVIRKTGERCCVGGGNITEKQRQHVWNNQSSFLGRTITIRYTELSKANVPLQPKLVNFTL